MPQCKYYIFKKVTNFEILFNSLIANKKNPGLDHLDESYEYILFYNNLYKLLKFNKYIKNLVQDTIYI